MTRDRLQDDTIVPDAAIDGNTWTCPFCGTSQTNLPSDGETASVRTALLAHVRGLAGGGHGPRHELPAAFADG